MLRTRTDLRNHSPDGFNWGYEGSGPTQLSLAILADCVGDEIAEQFYQDFKREVIAKFDQEKDWSMTDEEVKDQLLDIMAFREFKPQAGQA